jgi:16S rRNA (cytosine967-C5)-methyltransferase
VGKPAHAARYAALEALLAIERGEAAGHALDRALQGLADPRDRALATELAYGVSRRRQALDDELRPLLTRPLAASLIPG